MHVITDPGIEGMKTKKKEGIKKHKETQVGKKTKTQWLKDFRTHIALSIL